MVEGEGRFVFRRRNLALGFRVMCEMARILPEGTDDNGLRAMVGAYATVKVQLVEAPAGFDVDEFDPDDDVSYRRLAAVSVALAAKEAELKAGKVKAQVAASAIEAPAPTEAAADV
ncbi:MAG TPA: hypothetical protein VMU42_14420 [Candidatus Sulfotelmatobacter sp.]|nr:hypothetical protein [Candidatus Sulfotelmatobacter sp.]